MDLVEKPGAQGCFLFFPGLSFWIKLCFHSYLITLGFGSVGIVECLVIH